MITGDTPAVSKLAGIMGSNGKSSCRLCEHQGVYCPLSRHYYFPSKIRECVEERAIQIWRYMYDIDRPDMRSSESFGVTFMLLEDDSDLTRTQRERIQRETGIERRTVALSFPTTVAYESFPLDTMHLIMNISNDMMELLRGEIRVMNRVEGRVDEAEEFVIPANGWKSIDLEIGSISNGTSSSPFGNAPRVTSEYMRWKAVECKDFFRWYAVIFFKGRVSSAVLNDIQILSAIFDRCTWPTLSHAEVNDLKMHCGQFVKSFEARYFKYDIGRVGVCKSTIHALLHLGGL